MEIALVSDMHGNAIALDAVLKEIAEYPVDRIVCLGDAIQGGSEPSRVIELLKDLGCPVIMGNGDSFLLTGESAENVPQSAREIRTWTLEQIGEEGLDYIRTFLPTLEVDLDQKGGQKLLCFHGSPQSFDDVLLPDTPDEVFSKAFSSSSAVIFGGGHTHYQWSRWIGDRLFFNPGSIGLAYNRLLPGESFYFYPLAEYAVLSTSSEGTSIEFRHLVLDPEELERVTLNSGAPHAEVQAQRFRRPKK